MTEQYFPTHTTMQPPWYAEHEKLVELAYWMNEQGELDDIEAVLYFFEKPWKYEEEWKKYQRFIEAEKYRAVAGIPYNPSDPLDVFVWTAGEAEDILYDYSEEDVEAILSYGVWGNKPVHVRSLVQVWEERKDK